MQTVIFADRATPLHMEGDPQACRPTEGRMERGGSGGGGGGGHCRAAQLPDLSPRTTPCSKTKQKRKKKRPTATKPAGKRTVKDHLPHKALRRIAPHKHTELELSCSHTESVQKTDTIVSLPLFPSVVSLKTNTNQLSDPRCGEARR